MNTDKNTDFSETAEDAEDMDFKRVYHEKHEKGNFKGFGLSLGEWNYGPRLRGDDNIDTELSEKWCVCRNVDGDG